MFPPSPDVLLRKLRIYDKRQNVIASEAEGSTGTCDSRAAFGSEGLHSAHARHVLRRGTHKDDTVRCEYIGGGEKRQARQARVWEGG